jgi:hypothetical protein
MTRCSRSMLGCNPSLLDSVSYVGRPCQDPSRRSVSSGAVLSLSARVAIRLAVSRRTRSVRHPSTGVSCAASALRLDRLGRKPVAL